MTDPTVGSDMLALVQKIRDGDQASREAFASHIYDRLVKLARLILRNGSARVQRWEETDDLVHAAWFRIQRAIESSSLEITRQEQLFRLAARHIRFEIIDMHRKHRARAMGHQTKAQDADGQVAQDGNVYVANPSMDPQQVAQWAEFHELVERMPEPLKEVTDLLWYQGLTQEEAAQLLQVSVKSIKRRWRDAKLHLAEELDEGLLG